MIRGRFTYPICQPERPEDIDRPVLRGIRSVRKPFDRPLPSRLFGAACRGRFEKFCVNSEIAWSLNDRRAKAAA